MSINAAFPYEKPAGKQAQTVVKRDEKSSLPAVFSIWHELGAIAMEGAKTSAGAA
ncbi:hypothetical protein [Peribacillus sp. SCS-155]|uniref:hypothetical protein n=1 Tax=Peribacillus sedimenti TaxID=3115297 RepID=UPI003905B742